MYCMSTCVHLITEEYGGVDNTENCSTQHEHHEVQDVLISTFSVMNFVNSV